MPIGARDPWVQQYFAGLDCPADVRIPTDDCDSWAWFPAHRWVLDKLKVAESQGLLCGPHGVEPPRYPVFSKPILNLRGMGIGSRMVRSAAEHRYCAGHMWMEPLAGEHVSSDVAVVDGRPRWWRHVLGVPAGRGMFDHWVVLAEPRAGIEAHAGAWLERHLKGYTGMVNVETIGARIIEAHLRFADQWPDLYGGPAWVSAVIGLYRNGAWAFDDSARRAGWSVILFGPHGGTYRHPPAALQREIRATPGISSLQITFDEARPAAAHAMPPGGFRLAVVNCHDLAAGLAARERLAGAFGVDAPPRPGARRRRAA